MAEPNPFTSPGPGATPIPAPPLPVATAQPAGPASPPAVPAGNTAPLFGGLRGGRKRNDGLVPGSPEAREADKKKDRERKARKAEELRGSSDPAPLPAASPVTDGSAPPGDSPGDSPGAAGDPFLAWSGEDLSPAVSDTLALLEDADKLSIEKKLDACRLDSGLKKEVMADAAWPEQSKRGISRHGASALAKGLNALGLSAKHKDVALIAPSLAYLILDRVKLHKRLDELVAAANAPAQTQPTQPKPKP